MKIDGEHTAGANPDDEIEVGKEHGRTQFSEEAEKHYEKTLNSRSSLDASEYYAVTMGYLREHVCMAQCNLFIQILKDPKLRQ